MDHGLSETRAPVHPALADIDLVVFDLDGTLIGSAPDLAAAIDGMLADYGMPPAGVDKVRDWVGNGSHKLVERALADTADHAAAPRSASIDATVAHDLFISHYRAAPCVHTRLYAGANRCLKVLNAQGLTLALVTNKPAVFLPVLLKQLRIGAFFSLVIGGDTLTRKKPDPAPLLHVAQKLDITPRRCLMIGDSRHDMEAGKAAGFRTLAVTYGYNHWLQPRHTDRKQPSRSCDRLSARTALGSSGTTA